MRKAGLVVGSALLFVGMIYLSCGKDSGKGGEGSPEQENTGSSTGSTTDSSTNTTVQAGTVALETVQKIVQVTDPVAAFAADDTSADAVQARAFDVALKTSLTGQRGILFGMPHGEITTAFGANGSRAYCDSVNNAMKFLKEASTPDFNLCILKTVAAKGQAVKANEFQTWDFKIAADQGTQTYRMKFKIEPADDGSVKAFENFTCEAQGSATAQQSGYVKQTIDAGMVKVHTRGKGDHGQGEYKIRTDMEGKLNAAGRPIGIKKIDYAEQGDGEGRKVHVKVRQATHNIEVLGYETSGAYEEQFIRFVELLDDNAATGIYQITKLGYGSGAALLRQISGDGTTNKLAAWSADTLQSAPAEDRKSQVTGREAEFLAQAGDERNLAFADAETYECAGTADYTFEGKFKDFKDCLGAFEIDQEGGTMCNALSN